jgi:drug/metabolite transporter (DMT)-like permease
MASALRSGQRRWPDARLRIAVAAVLSSQFAALAALAAYAFFGERLSRVQLIGVCVVIAGVALLSALRA